MAALPKRVLLVDDDESIVEPLRHALADRGYEVLVARDGSEALRTVERDAPDLVLLDIVMPRRSGFSVLDRLSQGGMRPPPIIMLTANTEPQHRHYAESHGVAAYINKPFDLPALLERVDTLLADPADGRPD